MCRSLFKAPKNCYVHINYCNENLYARIIKRICCCNVQILNDKLKVSSTPLQLSLSNRKEKCIQDLFSRQIAKKFFFHKILNSISFTTMENKDNVNEVSDEVKSALEESSVTMLDILEQEKEMEEEYAAVLGGSDEKCCTHADGAVKRQALYSCLTCTPEVKENLKHAAGICLACSYRCHENHDLIELYTKRNFRCDCPTERLGRCALNAAMQQPQPNNAENAYNQNFKGLYCFCKRPYPDPESKEEEVMLQCTVCEDWYHLQHLDVPPSAAKLVDCGEMVCGMCMHRYAFLKDYVGLSLKALEEADESQANITISGDTSICEDANKASQNEARSENENLEKPKDTDVEEPPNKKLKTADESESINCKRPRGVADYDKGATFWSNDWRAALCKCEVCTALYKAEQVEFLLDVEDSAKIYEERGRKRAADNPSDYERGINALASLGRVQQIDAITEYNRMKDKLKEYLHTFAVSKKVVTEEDIKRFFDEMRNEKNASVGQPFFCR